MGTACAKTEGIEHVQGPRRSGGLGAREVCWASFLVVNAPSPGWESHPWVLQTCVSLGLKRVPLVCKGLGSLGGSAHGRGGR